MAHTIAFTIFCILGEIVYENVQGSKCKNLLDSENGTLDIQNLLENVIKGSKWTYIEANNYSNTTHSEITSHRKKTLELCHLRDKKNDCFELNCSCADANKNTSLRNSDTFLACTILKTRKNVARNEEEKINFTQCKQTEKVTENDDFLSKAMIEQHMQGDFRSFLPPLSLAFILGTVFGCFITIFTVQLCRRRQSKEQIYSLEDKQLYIKCGGETMAYSEISEIKRNSQELHDASANTGEYMEPITKNSIFHEESTFIADREENRENNEYFILKLDPCRRHSDGDGYNHLILNNRRISSAPLHTGNVDSLYHSMVHVSAVSEMEQGNEKHAETPFGLPKIPLDDHRAQICKAESKDIPKQNSPDEILYAKCIPVREITEDYTAAGMQENKENATIENNTLF